MTVHFEAGRDLLEGFSEHFSCAEAPLGYLIDIQSLCEKHRRSKEERVVHMALKWPKTDVQPEESLVPFIDEQIAEVVHSLSPYIYIYIYIYISIYPFIHPNLRLISFIFNTSLIFTPSLSRTRAIERSERERGRRGSLEPSRSWPRPVISEKIPKQCSHHRKYSDISWCVH